MLNLKFASLSDQGRVRLNNEDSCGQLVPEDPQELVEKGAVFVVADGMGGHRGGEIASRIAVRTILAFYSANVDEDRSAALARAFREANHTILQESVADSALFGMGTTCTALALRDGHAYYAHVGDSRAYQLREGALTQITHDHSIVGEMVRSGIITSEDARNHPKRNVITRSLGAQEDTAPDVADPPIPLHADDAFLICSDGLTTYLSDEDIAIVLTENEPEDACKQLVKIANERGGRDNITVQVIVVTSV